MARRRIHPLEGSQGIQETSLHTPLDQSRIIQAVLSLLQDEGLDSLTMRKIAESLGVKAASLYYHVKDKEQLLHLLAEQISSDVPFPDARLHWKEQLCEWALQFRLVLHRYRDAVSIMSATLARSPHRLDHIEYLFRLLAEAGFGDAQVPWFASMIKNFIYSFVEEENRLLARSRSKERTEEAGVSYSDYIQAMSKERYPQFIRLADYTTTVNWDEEFLFGLKVLMDGFEAQRT